MRPGGYSTKMGCRAKFGIQSLGRFYYDLDSIKVRKCVVPFIIWVKEHLETLKEAVSTAQDNFVVDSRRFYFSGVELDDEESCFCIDLDKGRWRELGYTPYYLDWPEVWEFCRFSAQKYTIMWDQVPNWEIYRSSRAGPVSVLKSE